jgi:cytochrome c peroxidase
MRIGVFRPAVAMLAVFAASVAGPGAQAAPPLADWSDAQIAVIASLRLSQLPPRAVDPSNAYESNPLAAALGRRLFFDPRFSRDGRVSCASCHDPARQFQDGRPRGQALGTTARRTMPLADAGYGPWLFWDGRKDSLWSQALSPMEDAREHGGNRLRFAHLAREHYGAENEAIFGPLPDLAKLLQDASPLGSAEEAAQWKSIDTPTQRAVSRVFANIGKAIAAFEKTLHRGPSRFDRYAEALVRGETPREHVLAPEELNGLRLFVGKGQCVTCHNGPLFTDHFFHSTRVPPLDPARPDAGRSAGAAAVLADEFNCLGPFSDAKPGECRELRFINAHDPVLRRAFKTPGLRGVADRAPYMHAGQFATLEEVIRHYVNAPEATIAKTATGHGHGEGSELQPVPLDESEIRDLAVFLRTLSGPVLEQPLAESRLQPAAAGR